MAESTSQHEYGECEPQDGLSDIDIRQTNHDIVDRNVINLFCFSVCRPTDCETVTNSSNNK